MMLQISASKKATPVLEMEQNNCNFYILNAKLKIWKCKVKKEKMVSLQKVDDE